MVEEAAVEEVELVEAVDVDVGPLPAERGEVCGEEGGAVGRGRRGGDCGGEARGDGGLVERFVGVPEAEEDALPELEEVRGGQARRGDGQEVGQEVPDRALPRAGVAGGQAPRDGGGLGGRVGGGGHGRGRGGEGRGKGGNPRRGSVRFDPWYV